MAIIYWLPVSCYSLSAMAFASTARATLRPALHIFCWVWQAPLLDGVLDDLAWQHAAQIDDFTEVKPNEGRPAEQRTVCYLARDNEFLYVAFECFEDDVDSMVLQNVSRDAFLTDDDRVEFVLDTFNNKQSAYFFQMSAAGSRGACGPRSAGAWPPRSCT